MKAGVERDIGHEYLTGFEERMSSSTRDTVPTKWDSVNDLMEGGLAGGELGVIVAPAGIGKSWTLQALGADAVRQGKTVVHYTLELNAQYVGLRYDTIVSGQPTGNLQYYKEEVLKKINQLKGNLIIKYYPTRSASVATLTAHLQQCELQGIKPDMVLVDYADIMKSTVNFKEKRHSIGHVYEELRGMAGTINTNTGYIQIYEANTQEGKQTQGKMDNAEEYMRKTLAQKKKDFDSEGFE